MMFWTIAAVVLVALFALAWWSSGRSKTGLVDRQRSIDKGTTSARAESWRNSNHTGGGAVGGGF